MQGREEGGLVLNVFSPTAALPGPGPAPALLPVMVWIHGGAFGMGSCTTGTLPHIF